MSEPIRASIAVMQSYGVAGASGELEQFPLSKFFTYDLPMLATWQHGNHKMQPGPSAGVNAIKHVPPVLSGVIVTVVNGAGAGDVGGAVGSAAP